MKEQARWSGGEGRDGEKREGGREEGGRERRGREGEKREGGREGGTYLEPAIVAYSETSILNEATIFLPVGPSC